jgi:hypothetical protein
MHLLLEWGTSPADVTMLPRPNSLPRDYARTAYEVGMTFTHDNDVVHLQPYTRYHARVLFRVLESSVVRSVPLCVN